MSLITQYWPDPLLKGDRSRITDGHSVHQVWDRPFPMLFADNTKNAVGGDVTYTITNLPAGADLTMSCAYAIASAGTVMYVLRNDWNWFAKSDAFSGSGNVSVRFTVPSDGIVRIRFQLAEYSKATFSGFVLCDSVMLQELRALTGDPHPSNDMHAVWGDLMPLS